MDIAKKMLAKKIDINTIIEVTGLEEKEIKKLQQNKIYELDSINIQQPF